MIIPDCFNTSLAEAEQAAFEILLSATNSQQNKHGFLGYDPNIVNTWYFETTVVGETDNLILEKVETLVYKCYAECSFQNRSDCQNWFMQILAALPVKEHEDSNIILFRIFKDNEIKSDYVQLKNEKTEKKIFSKSIEFDLEFMTGGKDTVI